jgi:3-methyladenine DNA glycosylase/8-oxoguanine DNA glycosylase
LSARRQLRYDPGEALAHLRAADSWLAGIMDQGGAFRLHHRATGSPFEALLRAIVYQQISSRAAAAIYARVLDLFDGRPAAAGVDELSDEDIRAAGLSRPKLAAVRDLAARTADGTVPDRRRLARMDDETVVERLTAVRGVGRWTAEMLLIFDLGRPDVLPVSDLGVRKGFARLMGRKKLPDERALARRGERWRPYRSVATWYLWRAMDVQPPG